MNKLLLAIALLVMLFACSPVRTINWISTTNDSPWVSNHPAILKKGTSAMAGVIIRTDQTRQTIDGFGGCFNLYGINSPPLAAKSNKFVHGTKQIYS